MKTIARLSILSALLLALAPVALADDVALYNTIPGALPPNLPSIGYEAVSVSEFGGLNVPDQIIYGLAYSTTNHGASPTGVQGPYDSLNFALATMPPTAGSNPLPGTVYWNTSNASFYTDGGAGGSGIFRQDTGWSPYTGAIEFLGTAEAPGGSEPSEIPEPPSLMLLSTGLLGLVVILIRSSRSFYPALKSK